jgi:tRNA-2-methylthio-N6-dimethylallyladenosine synthase
MVRAMFGCDKFCTYCIVPRVRGPEQSRPAAEICDEVRRLAGDGCLEVTLLGQTVNSYQDQSGPHTVRLADLLVMLHDVEGLRRLRFVTNYPKHMSDELLQAVRDLPKVSPYLHIPAQSGSSAVLRRMKRGYTAESYREMLARIHAVLPEVAIISDFIVGFCGETEEEFQETVELVRQSRFKNSFIFKYSARPGTKAAELYVDDIREAVKRRRNNELLAVQNAISLEDNQPLLGRTVEILVEGPSKVAKHRERANREADGAAVGSPHPGPLPEGVGTVAQLVGRTTSGRIDGPDHADRDRESRCVYVVRAASIERACGKIFWRCRNQGKQARLRAFSTEGGVRPDVYAGSCAIASFFRCDEVRPVHGAPGGGGRPVNGPDRYALRREHYPA